MKGSFNPVETIRSKRDGEVHSAAEIDDFIAQFTAGNVPDYQMSAWLMAIFQRGLDDRETVALTRAMLHSGKVLKLASVKAVKVDKHSTGGVGDKISICLAPLVAACGVAVPMISGRGLGHTGGTLDKLEAIPGYRVQLDAKRFERIVRDVGVSMIGQSPELAPADRRIYALRDVTATVECIPLIVASILSKKLAEGIDGLVLDVKVGRGAFMKDLKSARALAHALVRVGTGAGKRVVALLTDMSAPIGRTIGNGLETREAIETLQNAGPADTRELTLTLGAEMLLLGKAERTLPAARARLERALADGSALDCFLRMVEAHGGDTRVVEQPERLVRPKAKVEVLASRSGYVVECDPYALGMSSVALGAGRTRADQAVDAHAGIELLAQRGERVARGQPIAVIHARNTALAESEVSRVAGAFRLSAVKSRGRRVVIERIFQLKAAGALRTSEPGGVLLDLTPLETISSLRGIGRYVRGLASGLAQLAGESAFRVEGIAATSDLKRLFIVDDPFEYCLRPVVHPIPRSPARRRRLIQRSMAEVARERPGLLHLADPNGVPPANSVPFTLTCHDLIPLVLHRQYLAPVPFWPSLYGAIQRSHYRRSRRVLAVSNATKRDVCERLEIAAERVDVVWHGVDHDVFHLRAAEGERARLDAIVGGRGPYVLYLGAGDVRKDLDTLVGAFAQCGLQREARLVLAGNLGVKRTRSLTAKVRKLGIEDAVQFAGYVPEELVPALYRQAAVHVFVSRYEGFGLPVIEALACGAPTITSAGSALDEVAGDGALIVPCGEQDALSAALESAFFDSERRTELRQRGLTRALTFTWRKCAEQTIAFWQRANEA